jgi:hypothetical protein
MTSGPFYLTMKILEEIYEEFKWIRAGRFEYAYI